MTLHPVFSRPLRAVAVLLTITVTCTFAVQPRAQASLVPAQFSEATVSSQHQEDLRTIQATLESKAIRGRLHAMGLSDDQIQSRLSRLSDSEIHQMATQIRAVHPAGGFVIGILIVVLLVVLIVYLVKRI